MEVPSGTVTPPPLPVESPEKAKGKGLSWFRSRWQAYVNRDPVAERLSAFSFRQRLFNFLAVMMFCASAGLFYVTVAMIVDRIWELSMNSREIALFAALA